MVCRRDWLHRLLSQILYVITDMQAVLNRLGFFWSIIICSSLCMFLSVSVVYVSPLVSHVWTSVSGDYCLVCRFCFRGFLNRWLCNITFVNINILQCLKKKTILNRNFVNGVAFESLMWKKNMWLIFIYLLHYPITDFNNFRDFSNQNLVYKT